MDLWDHIESVIDDLIVTYEHALHEGFSKEDRLRAEGAIQALTELLSILDE